MPAITAVITGRVQGVGFRYTTQAMGEQLGLVGWVRNQPDGSVATWAQGSDDALARFTTYLEHGPRGARVTAVEVAAEEPDLTMRGFQVRF